ncbi:hypothetical protein M3J09_003172 [Ascochyta lentis]
MCLGCCKCHQEGSDFEEQAMRHAVQLRRIFPSFTCAARMSTPDALYLTGTSIASIDIAELEINAQEEETRQPVIACRLPR